MPRQGQCHEPPCGSCSCLARPARRAARRRAAALQVDRSRTARCSTGDAPPAVAGKPKKSQVRASARIGTGGSAAAASGDAAKTGAPKTAAEQEQAYRKRQDGRRGKARKDEKLAQDQRQKARELRRRAARARAACSRAARRAHQPKGERISSTTARSQQEISRLQREVVEWLQVVSLSRAARARRASFGSTAQRPVDLDPVAVVQAGGRARRACRRSRRRLRSRSISGKAASTPLRSIASRTVAPASSSRRTASWRSGVA